MGETSTYDLSFMARNDATQVNKNGSFALLLV